MRRALAGFGAVVGAILVLIGCREGRRSIPAVVAQGVIECVESQDKRLLRTNQFRLVIANQHLLVHFKDTRSDAGVQAVIDAAELGRWWSSEEADSEDSAWIQSRGMPFADGLPVLFQEQLVVFPMLWAGGPVGASLGTTLAVLPRTDYFTLLSSESHPAGIHVRDELEAGRLKRRRIHSYFSVGETNSDSVVPLFTVEYGRWHGSESNQVPASFVVEDQRQGRLFPSTRYQVRVESLVRTNLPLHQAYPDIRASQCTFTDRRSGKLTSGWAQKWPSRVLQADGTAGSGAGGTRLAVVIAGALVLGGLVLWGWKRSRTGQGG